MKLGEKTSQNYYENGGWGGLEEAWCTFPMESLVMRTIEFIVHAIVNSTWPLSSCDHRHSFLTLLGFFFSLVSWILSSFSFLFIFFIFRPSMDYEQGSKLDSCSIQFTMKKNWIIVLCVCVCVCEALRKMFRNKRIEREWKPDTGESYLFKQKLHT